MTRSGALCTLCTDRASGITSPQHGIANRPSPWAETTMPQVTKLTPLLYFVCGRPGHTTVGRPKFGLHRLPLEFLSWSRWLPYILRCGASRCCPVRVCFEILGFGVLESRTPHVIKGSCECEYGPGKCSSAHSGSVFIIR